MKTNGLSCSHSRSTAKAFKASAAEQADAHASILVVLTRRLAGPRPRLDTRGPWLGRCLPDYTLRYRDTTFSHVIRALIICDLILRLYRIWLFQICALEPNLAGFRNSNPARAGFGENLLWDHRTIRWMKLIASTMPSPPITKWQYSSVLRLLRLCLPVFDKICGMAIIIHVTLIKIANTPHDRSAVSVFIRN